MDGNNARSGIVIIARLQATEVSFTAIPLRAADEPRRQLCIRTVLIKVERIEASSTGENDVIPIKMKPFRRS